MKTTIYFVRHAEPDRSVGEDATYPLTAKGAADCALVTHFLSDKNIDIVLSSPFKRAVDTVKGFADSVSLNVGIVDDFRERRVSSEWVHDFDSFGRKQWDDFSYKLHDGESLNEVSKRNLRALEDVLTRFRGKNIVIGTHGTALSTIILNYDKTFGYDDWNHMPMPWIVQMDFNDDGCLGMVKTDVFDPNPVVDYSNCKVCTAPLGELKAYRYTVVFARYQDKWLYCRAKSRETFETAGGGIEPGETPTDAAKRELYEETGAVKFDIKPMFDYAVHLPGRYSNGQVFLAEVHELGDLPNYEMAETGLFATIPEKMRFPGILPVLYERVNA